MKKEADENAVREKKEDRRNYIDKKKLEAALNTRRDWEDTIGLEKEK